MSELLNIVKQVKAGAKHLEWIGKLAEALEKIGSIEQAAEETEARFKQMSTEINERTAVLDGIKANVDAEMATLDDKRDKAEATANSIVREASDKAEDIIKKAGYKVTSILDTANQQAESVVAGAKDRSKAATKHAEEQERRTAGLIDGARVAEEKTAKAETKLLALNNNILQARAEVKRMLGE